jgi:hypothetical protein
MPNGLTDVSPKPTSIKSGSTVKLTIKYQSKVMHDLTLSASGTFTVAPAKQSLAPSNDGVATLDVIVTRGDPHDPADCLLTCNFFNSLPVMIGVT